jgi:putative transposase
MPQIWIAMCVYLLRAYLKFASQIDRSLQQILRVPHLNLFECRDLMALLRGDPPVPKVSPLQTRLVFA